MQVFGSNHFFITPFPFKFNILDIPSIHKESNEKGPTIRITGIVGSANYISGGRYRGHLLPTYRTYME